MSVNSLGLHAELDELGPAEWAFQTLLRIAAYGLHDSNRHRLRVATLDARAKHRAETPDRRSTT